MTYDTRTQTIEKSKYIFFPPSIGLFQKLSINQLQYSKFCKGIAHDKYRKKGEKLSVAYLCPLDGHSSEIWGLCLMKCSSEMLQNLAYFWNKKTQLVLYNWVFLFQKYAKFWSVSLENFIKHKNLISEECWYTLWSNTEYILKAFITSRLKKWNLASCSSLYKNLGTYLGKKNSPFN